MLWHIWLLHHLSSNIYLTYSLRYCLNALYCMAAFIGMLHGGVFMESCFYPAFVNCILSTITDVGTLHFNPSLPFYSIMRCFFDVHLSNAYFLNRLTGNML